MGLPVLAEHDSGGYSLSVNHPEVEGTLEFRNQAVAQAVMNFLLEFNPYAFVPEPRVAESTTVEAEATTLPAATIAALEVIGTVDADESGPQMMDKAEAESR